MKIYDNFILREIAGEWIVIPRGANALNFKNTIILNETGALLFKHIAAECTENDLVDVLQAEYVVDRDTASRDVKEFLNKMVEHKIILL